MSANNWPGAVPFDPAAELLPAPVDAIWSQLAEAGHILVLAHGSRSWLQDWAVPTVLAIARAGAESGARVLLADLSLESPTLHLQLGEENLEGVADIFQFGASLERVARLVPDSGFSFLPAGAYIPDPVALLGSPIWGRILNRLVEEETRLLAFLPLDTPGADSLASQIATRILLTEEADTGDLASIASGLGGEFDLVLYPLVVLDASAPPEQSETLPEADDGDKDSIDRPDLATGAADEAVRGDETGAEAPVVQPELEAAPVALGSVDQQGQPEHLQGDDPESSEPGVVEPEAESAIAEVAEFLDEPPIMPREEKRRRRVSPVLWILLLLTAAAGVWTLLQSRDLLPHWARSWSGSTSSQGTLVDGEGEGLAEKAAIPQEGAEPIDSPIPYSVAVEAHQDYRTAEERVDALRESRPEIAFYLSPIENQGVVYYRILAGPASDSAAAWSLMKELLSTRHKTDLDPWSIRPTVWAYDLGDYLSSEDAEARSAELRELRVPTYLVEVEYTDGTTRYRVYAGAFEGPAPAEILAARLREAGIETRLVRRSGKSRP